MTVSPARRSRLAALVDTLFDHPRLIAWALAALLVGAAVAGIWIWRTP